MFKFFYYSLKDAKKGYWPLVKKVAHSSVLHIIEKHPQISMEAQKGIENFHVLSTFFMPSIRLSSKI